MAEKLKVQVADLSLFLEEERMLHKDTKRRVNIDTNRVLAYDYS